ncbi:hypothetical protein [Sorangium sp. So ce145]|uniref:hypothetical protein n=1 Tax=Sorangium sp. So ce145 TaxID=3133285 RepID=UPI003F5DC60D
MVAITRSAVYSSARSSAVAASVWMWADRPQHRHGRVPGERREHQPEHAAARPQLGDRALVDGIDAEVRAAERPPRPRDAAFARRRQSPPAARQDHGDALDRRHRLPVGIEAERGEEEAEVLEEAIRARGR